MSGFVLSVFQLTQAIKLHLEKQFPHILVEGEISNFKRQSSGHLYFTLKDPKAQIQCAMFAPDARLLKTLPKNGDQVQIRGEINVYPPRGNYQIIVRSLEQAGLGKLLVLLQERKEKFLKLGYFDSDRKQPLPPFPKKIGIVTSPTGAVISDILQILHRRAHGFHVVLNPVKVQGEGAAKEIATAIQQFNQHQLIDVLIVGRGGGSLEDLWPFNEEIVVEAIARSQIPIISAVGHETDTTLADLAADLRAPTPSAAAELVIAEKESYHNFLNTSKARLDQAWRQLFNLKQQKLEFFLKQPLLVSPYKLLEVFQQKVDELQTELDYRMQILLGKLKEKCQHKQLELQRQNPEKLLEQKKFYILSLQEKLDFALQKQLDHKRHKFKTLTTHLMAIDPKKLLQQGYSILFDEKRKRAILSVKDISLKQNLKLILSDGVCDAVVENITSDPYEQKQS